MVRGKGGDWVERTDGIIQKLRLLGVYVSLFTLPREFLILMAWKIVDRVSLLYRHRHRRHSTSCANTRSISYSYHQ